MRESEPLLEERGGAKGPRLSVELRDGKEIALGVQDAEVDAVEEGAALKKEEVPRKGVGENGALELVGHPAEAAPDNEQPIQIGGTNFHGSSIRTEPEI